jgi:hypothetical protein
MPVYRGTIPPGGTTMSEGSFWPQSWREALPLLVWGVLIFAFGFEGVASLIHGEWWQTIFGFGGMLGLTAMLVYWTRIQKLKDIRWLVAASMVALIVVALSPYIEQQRWPFTAARTPMPLLPPNSTMATGPDGKRYVVTAAAPFTRLKFLIREGQDPPRTGKNQR